MYEPKEEEVSGKLIKLRNRKQALMDMGAVRQT